MQDAGKTKPKSVRDSSYGQGINFLRMAQQAHGMRLSATQVSSAVTAIKDRSVTRSQSEHHPYPTTRTTQNHLELACALPSQQAQRKKVMQVGMHGLG